MKRIATIATTALLFSGGLFNVPAQADEPDCGLTCLQVPSGSANVCAGQVDPLHKIIGIMSEDRAAMDRLLAEAQAREIALTSKVERQAARIERLRAKLAAKR